MKKIKIFRLGAILSVLLMSWSCNTDYPNLLKEGYGNDIEGKAIMSKKVLYVIVDGVNGDVLKTVAPTNIANYANNAVYSYESLTDNNSYVSNKSTGWTTLLTGRNPAHHGVHGSNTQPDFTSSPTIFKILDKKKTVLYSASAGFSSLFGAEADQSFTLTSDEDVKNDVVQSLASSDNDLTVVNFVSVDAAGQNGGYTASNTSYVSAIQTIDGYINTLVEAVKSRTNYAKEDWLVVLTSDRGTSHGTASAQSNYFLIPEKNNFMVFYNPRLVSRYYARPGTEIPFDRGTLKFTMNPVTNATKAVMADGNQFNIAFPTIGSGQTIQFKIKYSGNGASSSWPEFLTKALNSSNTTGGYTLFSSSGSTGFQFKANTTGGATAISGVPIGDNDWHTMTIVFAKEQSSSVMMRVYMDATERGSRDLGNITTLSNSYPITIGRISPSSVGGSPVMNISQVLIFNTPLTATQIQNTYCKTEIDETHPAYDKLGGLWRFDEMTGNTVKNKVNENPNQSFILSGLQNWEHYNSYSPNLCPPVTESYYKVVPFAADAPLTILQWMGASLNDYRNLDGRTWPFNYNNLKAE